MEVSVADGKYVLCFNEQTGEITALRHGEPWGRDFCGDKLVLSLALELNEARDMASKERSLREQIEQRCDPAGDTRELAARREQVEALTKLLEESMAARDYWHQLYHQENLNYNGAMNAKLAAETDCGKLWNEQNDARKAAEQRLDALEKRVRDLGHAAYPQGSGRTI